MKKKNIELQPADSIEELEVDSLLNSGSKKQSSGDIEIIPLKDFEPGIHQNEIHIDNIKEGVPVTIPRRFLQNMVTEGVINKLPDEG